MQYTLKQTLQRFIVLLPISDIVPGHQQGTSLTVSTVHVQGMRAVI